MSTPPTKRAGGPGKEEHIRALEGHGSSLGRLAADFAIFLQRYVGVEGSMGKRQDIIKFADGLRAHSLKLRSMADDISLISSSILTFATDQGEGRDEKIKFRRSQKPDHVVSMEPCDYADRKKFDKIISSQPQTVSEFWKNKYEEDAGRNWDLFYKRNENRFFKDRHYLHHIMGKDIKSAILKAKKDGTNPVLMEVGCGVGNTMFPLLTDFPELHVYGVDISKNAIEILQQRPQFKQNSNRSKVWVCDLVNSEIPKEMPPSDISTLIFVLSAINPTGIVGVLRKVLKAMKPGGILFIRDYAIYDLSQIRFGAGSKLEENLYVRQDGTRTYFFSTETLGDMLKEAGFDIISIEYHRKNIKNAKKGIEMKRTWIQSSSRKPLLS
ncbi:hypothetical protein AAMO2058_001751500 [Amorphochlora amoebiformis]